MGFIYLFTNNPQGGEKIDRLDGAHAPELTNKVQRLGSGGGGAAGVGADAKDDLNERLKKLISAAPCMLFMKGSPQEPRCGKHVFTHARINQHKRMHVTVRGR